MTGSLVNVVIAAQNNTGVALAAAARNIQTLRKGIASTSAQLREFGATSKTAMRGDDIAAYGRQLDRTRAKYNPMFAAIQRYKTYVEEVRRAHAVGAISINEMTAAIGRERSKTLATTKALRDAGRATMALGAASGVAGTRVTSMGNAIARSSRMAAFQTRNLVFQLNDIGVSLISGMNPMIVAAQQGSQISTIYGPEEGGLGRAFQETGRLAKGMITKFAPFAGIVALGAASLAGLTYEINRASKANLNMGDIARATWQVFADSIFNIAHPAIEAVSPWIASLWNTIVSITKQGVNLFIGTFVWAFKGVKAVWENLPAVMDDIIISAVNNLIGGTQNMVNAAIDGINMLSDAVNNIPGISIPQLGKIDLSGLQRETKGAWANYAKTAREAMVSSLTTDYAGGTFAKIMARALANAKKQAEGLGGALSAANNKAIDLMGGIKGAGEKISGWAKSLASSFSGVGSEMMKVLRGTGTFGEKMTGIFDVLINRVQKFADTLLDQALNAGLNMLLGSMFGGGGSSLGLSRAVGGMALYASGGYTGGGALNQAAGIVHGQEYVLSAAATRQIGVSNLDAMNAGRAPVANANNPRAANGNNLNITINVDARGAQQGVAAEVARQVGDIMRYELPDRMARISADPYARG